MASCEHKSCGTNEKVWMPHIFEGRDRGLKPHPYCAECGLIKNLSSVRPHSIGFFTNAIAELGNHHKIAQVQTRLIVQEMEKLQIDDNYGIDKHQQEEIFVDIVTRMLNVSQREVRQLLK